MQKKITVCLITGLVCDIFTKGDYVYNIPFEISQPLLNFEELHVVAIYFHFTKIIALRVQFKSALLHSQCTLTLHIHSVIFCSFNDNKEKIEKVFFS